MLVVGTVLTVAACTPGENGTTSVTTANTNSTTQGTVVSGLPIDLHSADDFALLAGTGIATIATSAITGNVGVSPAAASYLTGFDLILDASGTFSTSTQVVGNLYAADYAVDTPIYMSTAIADLGIAYNDGLSRTPDFTELYTGDLSGKTLVAGVYAWSNDVLINTDLTLNGNSTDVWIFQIAGTLTQAANISVTLTGGALPKNVFWVVADTVALGVGAHMEGVILAKTNFSMGTGASINGMVLAQTSIAIDACIITKPQF